MRYYAIAIKDPQTGKTLVPDPKTRQFSRVDSGSNVSTYSSLAPGASPMTIGGTLQGALKVEIDAPVVPFATPQGAAYVRIFGISLAEIGQQSSLEGLNIEVRGGMAAGLPLAKPQQSGLLFSGQVFQAFGNWRGTEMTLDLVILPGGGTFEVPKNIVIDWKKGAKLSDAMKQTLGIAFPGAKQQINIAPELVLSNNEPGLYSTMTAFSQYVKGISQMIGGAGYAGVDVVLSGDTIYAYDGTVRPDPIQLAFEDMVGQPTWIDAATINVPMVMRADLQVGSFIKLPQGASTPYVLTSTPAAAPGAPSRNKSAFQGTFTITAMHHFGSSRQPSADAWITSINAVVAPAEKTGNVSIEFVPSPPGAPNTPTGS